MNLADLDNETESKIDQIIYAWNYLSWGGAQIYFLGLIREARKYFKIKVLLPQGSDPQLLKFFKDENIECDQFAPAFVPPGGSGLVSKIRLHKVKMESERALLKALREKYDLQRSIVHVELAPWQSLSSLVWLCLRTKVFITMHNSLQEVSVLRKSLWKLKLRAISHFRGFNPFSSNEDSKNYFRGLFSDDLHKRILVTYTNVNPVEIETALADDIDSEGIRRHNKLREDSFLVLCVGQFVDRKGRWTFLEAAKEIVSKNADIDFAWVSNTPLDDNDSKRVESYGLGDRFTLINSDEVGPAHIDLFRLMRVSDVFVLPSFVEGLPISLLEAMALGLPSVSTRINAIPEAVIHEETGCLVEAGNSKDLAATILKLNQSKDLRERLGAAGREIVLRKFNEKQVAKLAVARYLEVAERQAE